MFLLAQLGTSLENEPVKRMSEIAIGRAWEALMPASSMGFEHNNQVVVCCADPGQINPKQP
jgi:hypothetical protein